MKSLGTAKHYVMFIWYLQRFWIEKSPATLVLRCAQPQPHQVPARRWRWEVLVGCPGVEDVVVRQELDVADIQDHVKSETQAGLVEDSSSTNLLRRERRDDALVAKARKGFDIVWVPPDLH